MLENAVISVSTLVTYSFSAFKLYLFCCIGNLKMNSWQKDNFFLKHNKDNRFSFQCHIEACAPCCSPTLLWLYFLLKKKDKKDQKIEKCRGEGQFFCLHWLFMLVLWTLVRRTEARKSRCCLKSYLKGGWSEEMSGQTCDCGFSWPDTVWYPAAWQLYPISSVNGVLICLSFPLCLIWGYWFLTPEFVGRASWN